MIYIQLFFSFLQVGLFSFGGGYAAMPLIRTVYNAPVAEHVGVYGSDHNFADDTGTDCGQFGNFCRN